MFSGIYFLFSFDWGGRDLFLFGSCFVVSLSLAGDGWRRESECAAAACSDDA